MMKIATLLLWWLGSGMRLGMDGLVTSASARNEAAKKLLYDVFTAAEGIREHANVTQKVKDAIYAAVYGAPGGVQFTDDGKFNHSHLFRRGKQYQRQKVCEYYNHHRGVDQTDGDFAENPFWGLCVFVCPAYHDMLYHLVWCVSQTPEKSMVGVPWQG
ncbi:unnamed protein product [Trypanosoma congolense IL3000]|uniref:WGS project CAEQ00000000 data, annotated contig 1119 n=1 Tax=Trypanosoma congolense (strain IL3000) TaxID=1068625 RepID=F9W3W2_TRYCI|nr:unnamed protein product [Trypanosoma congolense IL3000]